MKTIIRTILFISVVLLAACNEEQPQPMQTIVDTVEVINHIQEYPSTLVGTTWYSLDTAYESHEEPADSIYLQMLFRTDSTYELIRQVKGSNIDMILVQGYYSYTYENGVIGLTTSYKNQIYQVEGLVYRDSLRLYGDRAYLRQKTYIW